MRLRLDEHEAALVDLALYKMIDEGYNRLYAASMKNSGVPKEAADALDRDIKKLGEIRLRLQDQMK